MNSTGSFQPRCLNTTVVPSSSCLRIEHTQRADPLVGPVEHSQGALVVIELEDVHVEPGAEVELEHFPDEAVAMDVGRPPAERPSVVVNASFSPGLDSPLSGALNGLGDPFDAPQPRVPGRPDFCELRGRAGELRIVHPVAHLPSGRRDVDKADAVEHPEMLRDRLTRDGQSVAQGGGRTAPIRQEQVEHPTPRRIPDRRPEVVVDRDGHRVDVNWMTYSPMRGTKASQPTLCSL
ncbi:MAG: hypothetical protein JWO62_3713 [Acidimicrobiaceae bacterium]|nr:hypothetical protein [Acidimicrobiaceae bacterium]